MRLPVAEDWNCFTTRLKYRLEPKKLAQQRFDAWRECEDPYRMQRSVITSINGFYLIHRTGMILIRLRYGLPSRNCVPIRSPTLRNAERKLLNESKKNTSTGTLIECPGLVYALNRR